MMILHGNIIGADFYKLDFLTFIFINFIVFSFILIVLINNNNQNCNFYL